MGTRADFYVGRGLKADWVASIAWDGYPEGIEDKIKDATTREEFLLELGKYLSKRKDATLAKDGWPWPWDDSRTTDYAYAFDEGKVWASCFGHQWFEANKPEDTENDGEKTALFPDMKDRKNVAHGSDKSGIIIVSTPIL
jgi:hypothetical protein